eukprot:COSAG02_NODE_1252_length_13595_cov_2.754148_9_plen_46_part_00
MLLICFSPYESNDDAALMKALAPEWFEATAKTLGSSQGHGVRSIT